MQIQNKPTIYFIGVTTQSSSIMKVFPKWSDILGLGAQIAGYDAPLHAPDAVYREIVQHIKRDPQSRGALVTTHKIDLLHACRDLFDDLDPYAEICGEISCISKAGGELRGHAKDPISSGLTLDHFVPSGHWQKTGGHVLCLGTGGAAIAISVFLAEQSKTGDFPQQCVMVDVSQERLDALRQIHQRIESPIQFVYRVTQSPAENDALMTALPPGSMVINATGMGKDRPGSPITDAALFPQHGLVWELNYRGALDFMHQAERQVASRNLRIEDGWIYFLHGWTQVIAEVFHINLTDDLFRQLNAAASALRP
ncbi:MAG: shikimate dehydrogenase [Anaerolineae bacterium]|nr:shikimate dehydrogenase [Anaerolineae bacterium]